MQEKKKEENKNIENMKKNMNNRKQGLPSGPQKQEQNENVQQVVGSSFSPQEMMVRLKHEIRKMYKIFFMFAYNL